MRTPSQNVCIIIQLHVNMYCNVLGVARLLQTHCTAHAAGMCAGKRRLHSSDLSNASIADTVSELLDMETLLSVSTLQGNTGRSADSNDKHAATEPEQIEPEQNSITLEPIHITPILNINGKLAAVLPMEVLRTTWEGRGATDVAACLSGALLTTSNVSLLAPRGVMASLGLQGTATALADDMLSQLMPKVALLLFLPLPCTGTGPGCRPRS
jgi:hypothetical protein